MSDESREGFVIARPMTVTSHARRSHTKSKQGCKRCKIRRIKCDETHPVCNQCQKHNVECDFSSTTTASGPLRDPSQRAVSRPPGRNHGSNVQRLPTPQSPPSSSSSSLLSHPDTPTPFAYATMDERMLELRVFHHLTQMHTAKQGQFPIAVDLWQQRVPHIALTLPCLMDGVLATTALHMHEQVPNDKEVMIASRKYIGRAVKQFAGVLAEGKLDGKFEAVYMTSLVIALHSLSERRYCHIGPESSPADIFRPYQGIKAVWQAYSEEQKTDSPMTIYPGWQGVAPCRHHPDECSFSFLLEGLGQHGLNTETQHAYNFAMSCVCHLYHGTLPRPLLVFLAVAPSRLVALLDKRDQRAMVLVGSFYVLMSLGQHPWWMHGVPEKEIAFIRTLLVDPFYSRLNSIATIRIKKEE